MKSAPGHILVVCTANICRSPMAAALLQHALAAQPEPLRSLKVISASVAGGSGDSVSANSVTAMKKVGIDISGHRSQPVTDELVDHAALVLGMTESHRAMLLSHRASDPDHIYLFREFLPPPADIEIGDPYGGPLKFYESARDEMVEALPSLVEFIKSKLGKPDAG